MLSIFSYFCIFANLFVELNRASVIAAAVVGGVLLALILGILIVIYRFVQGENCATYN